MLPLIVLPLKTPANRGGPVSKTSVDLPSQAVEGDGGALLPISDEQTAMAREDANVIYVHMGHNTSWDLYCVHASVSVATLKRTVAKRKKIAVQRLVCMDSRDRVYQDKDVLQLQHNQDIIMKRTPPQPTRKRRCVDGVYQPHHIPARHIWTDRLFSQPDAGVVDLDHDSENHDELSTSRLEGGGSTALMDTCESVLMPPVAHPGRIKVARTCQRFGDQSHAVEVKCDKCGMLLPCAHLFDAGNGVGGRAMGHQNNVLIWSMAGSFYHPCCQVIYLGVMCRYMSSYKRDGQSSGCLTAHQPLLCEDGNETTWDDCWWNVVCPRSETSVNISGRAIHGGGPQNPDASDHEVPLLVLAPDQKWSCPGCGRAECIHQVGERRRPPRLVQWLCPGCGQATCSHKRPQESTDDLVTVDVKSPKDSVGDGAKDDVTLSAGGRDASQEPRSNDISGLVKEAKQCGTGLSPAQLRMIFQSDGPAKAKFLKQTSHAVRHDILMAAARRVNLEPKGEVHRPRKQSQNPEEARGRNARERSVPPEAGSTDGASRRERSRGPKREAGSGNSGPAAAVPPSRATPRAATPARSGNKPKYEKPPAKYALIQERWSVPLASFVKEEEVTGDGIFMIEDPEVAKRLYRRACQIPQFALAFVSPRPLLPEQLDPKEIIIEVERVRGDDKGSLTMRAFLHQLTSKAVTQTKPSVEITLAKKNDTTVVAVSQSFAAAPEGWKDDLNKTAKDLLVAALPQEARGAVLDVWATKQSEESSYRSLVRMAAKHVPTVLALSGTKGVWADTPQTQRHLYRLLWLREVTELKEAQKMLEKVKNHGGLVQKSQGPKTSFAVRILTQHADTAKNDLSMDLDESYIVSGLPVELLHADVQHMMSQLKWNAKIVENTKRCRRQQASWIAKSQEPPPGHAFPLKYGTEKLHIAIDSTRRHRQLCEVTPPEVDPTAVRAPRSWASVVSGKAPVVSHGANTRARSTSRKRSIPTEEPRERSASVTSVQSRGDSRGSSAEKRTRFSENTQYWSHLDEDDDENEDMLDDLWAEENVHQQVAQMQRDQGALHAKVDKLYGLIEQLTSRQSGANAGIIQQPPQQQQPPPKPLTGGGGTGSQVPPS